MKNILKKLLLTSIAITPLMSLNAKQLTGLEFQTLDTACISYPMTTLQIKSTEDKVKQVLAVISEKTTTRTSNKPKDEKAFIKQQLNIMLKPVEKFFDAMIKYKQIVLPLIEQSLSDVPGSSKQATPLLLRLCQGHANNDVRSFCEKEISSIDLLEEFCIDLSNFISDFNESLSPEANKAYDDFYKKLIEKVRNKKSKQASNKKPTTKRKHN